METDSERYKIVYECYESRILFGFYAYDDWLPSVPVICRYFRMPTATVRFAMARLEEAGYVRILDRKPARVIYKANLQGYRRNMAEYFAAHREGIADLVESGGLLFAPVHLYPRGGTVAARFYTFAFEADNSLLSNLYSEIIRYLRFPYLTGDEPPEEGVVDSSEKDFVLFQKKLQAEYQQDVRKLFDFIDRASEEFSLKTVEQIPFHWNVYRHRPQMRYTLASLIIQEIVSGKYPVGSYLPSLPRMAEQHGVGVNTVRRTLEILNKLGVAETFHGKGTLACMKPAEINLADSDLSEGLRLFMESLQLLALTIQPVLLSVLERSTLEQRRKHAQQYVLLLKNHESYRGIDVCLLFIEEVCPMAFIRECYRKIRELLAWGYPFAILRAKKEGRSIHAIYAESMEQIVVFLQKGENQAVSEKWKQVLESDVNAYVPGCSG